MRNFVSVEYGTHNDLELGYSFLIQVTFGRAFEATPGPSRWQEGVESSPTVNHEPERTERTH
jgi:hypothetical protein